MTLPSDVNEGINQALEVASPETSTAQTGKSGVSATARVDAPGTMIENLIRKVEELAEVGQ